MRRPHFSRECLALVADTSLSGLRVTRELDALLATRGKPSTIDSDNGTASLDIDDLGAALT